jgi:four helix bundle protein
MGDFHGLVVWHKAHALALAVYRLTEHFPRQELYGLTSQLRRASTSIPANIAEGCGRSGNAELARFLRIALGSASELEYHLLLARDLGYLTPPEFAEATDATQQVKRMLTRLVVRLITDD